MARKDGHVIDPSAEYSYDPSRLIGAILNRELSDDEVTEFAAGIVAHWLRGKSGDDGFDVAKTLSALRELQDAGLVGVGADGCAFAGKPVVGPLGTPVGCRPVPWHPGIQQMAEFNRAAHTGDISVALRSEGLTRI